MKTKLSPKAGILGIAEVFLHKGKVKRKNQTTCICGTEKSLKNMNPKEWQQNREKKPRTCTVFINIYDYVGLFLAHNSW